MAQSWGLKRHSRVRQESVKPLLPPSFTLRPALVSQHSIIYPTHHLLSLPYEVREKIWRLIFQDVAHNPIYEYWLNPHTRYDGLSLTCRQIHLETKDLWPLLLVTSNRVEKFLSQPHSKYQLSMMQRLSLELPFSLKRNLMTDLAQVLAHPSMGARLEHLQIFFTGADAYGTRTYVHGCGNVIATSKSTSKKLPIDGQMADGRIRLLLALENLTVLRSLVLRNCQFPLLERTMFVNKRKLEKLHISTDPRTTLHRQFALNNPRLHNPFVGVFPPVKELQISANAINSAAAVITGMAPTLEKLSWVIPDPSRQVENCGKTWFSDTRVMLQNLELRAPNLHTLRICTEGTIYEGGKQYSDLIGASNTFLCRQRGLKLFEFHATSRSPWFGSEVIGALPDLVRRVYLSDYTLSVPDLVETIEARYLSVDPVEEGQHVDSNALKMLNDDHDRLGHISYTRGSLSFVTVEFNDQDHDAALLNLNGRLLDRERNSHLATFSNTCFKYIQRTGRARFKDSGRLFYLRPRFSDDTRYRWTRSWMDVYGNTVEKDWLLTIQEIQNSMNQAGEASDSGFNMISHPYFGDETGAEHIFFREKVASAEEVLARKSTYPEIVEIDKVNHGYHHWMSDEN